MRLPTALIPCLPLIALAAMVTPVSTWAQSCDARAQGVRGDGGGDETAALQSAIDACAAKGGGVLTLGDGVYVTGPLRLRSHVHLALDPGAHLRAIDDPTRYTWAFVGQPWRQGEALISLVGVEDAGITGGGTIDGQGAALWWPQARAAKAAGTLGLGFEDIPIANGLPRPWLVEVADSRGVTISGVHLSNSPMWTLVVRNTTDVWIEGVRISNPADAPNTDGIDIVSSSAVRMRDLDISTGDDDIAIKSGLVPGGAPSQDITLAHSRIGAGHGVSIGSELANGVRHIHFTDLSFQGGQAGIRIKSGRDRGGEICDILAQNIRLTGVRTPLSISDYYSGEPGGGSLPEGRQDTPRPITPTTPRIHDVTIRDLRASGADTAGLLAGLPEAPLRAIRLEKVSIHAATGLRVRHASVRLEGVAVRVDGGSAVLREGQDAVIDDAPPSRPERRAQE